MLLSRKITYAFGLLALAISFIAFSPIAVNAIDRNDDNQSVQDTTTNTGETDDDNSQESSRSRVRSEDVENVIEQNRSKAEKEVTAERKTRVRLDDETRSQLCENRREAIQNKVRAYSNHANAYLDRLDGVDANLKTYLEANTITELSLSDASKAQATAAAEVLALEKIVGGAEIDCTNVIDNATWLAEVRSAATKTKTALKAYRNELKKVVTAISIAQEKTQQDSSDDNSTDSNSDSSTEAEQQGV